jgi:uncharacterized membrane protein YeaQ/YmgE (transglycosylase-associated protein family)
MTLVELLVLVIIAAVAGAVGRSLRGYGSGGFLLAAVLGFIGALLGTWLADALGLPRVIDINVGGVSFPLIWAIIGAALLVALFGLMGTGGYSWSITPPTKIMLTLSIVLVVLGMLISAGVLSVSLSAYTLVVIGYGLLLLGNLVNGL